MTTTRARFMALACLSACAFGAVTAQAPERIDSAMNAKIRAEGLDRSKLMWIEHYLTDVYGPRPVGSPNHVAAANWAVKTMTSWGMKNAHLEPFTWRGVGWLPGRATGFITSPVKANLKFEAQPWSPSTKGTVSGPVVSIVAPETPTEDELVAYLTPLAPKVKGGIVMVGPPPNVPVNFAERPKRTPDEDVRARYQEPPGAGGRGGRGGGPGGFGRGGRGGAPAVPEGHLSAQQVTQRLDAFLRDNMPALRLVAQGPGRIPGVIVAQNGRGQIYDDTTPQPPAVILRTDDYGRIYRIIQDGTPVTVEFNVQNQFFPEGKTSYVTVADIPGTDRADELVMMGGHLDSWASATGATDNAIGCAIMMEAARILETVGAKPRRTIRVALWSGEEEGELGSFAYVKDHFGSAEEPKPDFNKVDAYWNIDDGTGRVRGASIFGPPAAAAIIAQYFKPFEDWGIYGALPSTARVEGGSDNGAFAVAGLPGIGTQQDNIEYNSTTWHTNLDTYERIVPEDVTHNAVITASLMYHLAMRDEMLPRFAAGEMPPVPTGRGGGRGGAGPAGPVAIAHVYAASKGKALAVLHAPGLNEAGGRGGEPTMVAIASKPAHGTVALKADGTFTYTPAAGFAGTDVFTYTVTSGNETSAPGKVTIVVK
ncbi:MAG TPA: M20/M25/M40 family metallo-hydrolase [Gemmatimonadaceae bacterium]|nr:M20/M25/M40 family metallo-hydrolase [Gemmatimonadaceae bacterium]